MSAPVRVAHGYGNRRNLISEAIDAGADAIEADLRYDSGEVFIRHEHRLRPFPILYNWRLARGHKHGPFALSVGPLYLRIDFNRLTLRGMLNAVGGRCGLMLDLKPDHRSLPETDAFIAAVLREVQTFAAPVQYVGSWALLDAMRAASADASLRYSVDNLAQWTAVQLRLDSGEVTAISLNYSLLTPERATRLREVNVGFYCWAAGTSENARRAIDLGADGIIAPLKVLRGIAPSAKAPA